jgi:hypothetical protein
MQPWGKAWSLRRIDDWSSVDREGKVRARSMDSEALRGRLRSTDAGCEGEKVSAVEVERAWATAWRQWAPVAEVMEGCLIAFGSQ